MFSVPLICSSSGEATVSAITLGLAPGNCAFTTTVGGTTSGYSEIGSWNTDTAPARKIRTEMTPAKIGRSIKKRERFMGAPQQCLEQVTCGAIWQLANRCPASLPQRQRRCLVEGAARHPRQCDRQPARP